VSPWVPRVLGGLAVLGIGFAIYSIATGSGGPQAATIGGVNDVQRIFGGISQDGDRLGPEDAETEITVFNDIQCAPCASYQIETINPLVERYARTEEAALVFRHFSLAPNDTTLAAIAAEAAGEQERQWQYLDTLVRNLDVAAGAVDEEFLRDVAEAVPQLELEQWQEDYEAPETAELVRTDAILANELMLPAQPAVVVTGPGGQRQLEDYPSLEQIETAIAQVSEPG
jgi:protein-disulfide isomerase